LSEIGLIGRILIGLISRIGRIMIGLIGLIGRIGLIGLIRFQALPGNCAARRPHGARVGRAVACSAPPIELALRLLSPA